MLLYARIGVMALDTPERVKYFGLRSQCACPICRARRGRSKTRKATCHCPRQIAEFYATANADARTRPQRRARKRARERLRNHGFKYDKRCTLTDHAKHSLVQIPSIGPRMFAGLARYERMHVYFIAYCNYAMDLLVKSVHKRHFPTVAQVVTQCHQFRNTLTGATHPRLPNLLKMTHLTAERRVRAIFYWAHVLGLCADVIDAPIRMAAQRAVAFLQLILIATRGHRAYTARELEEIFTGAGKQFFMALEEMALHHDYQAFNRAAVNHRRDPARYAAPIHFRPVLRHSSDSSTDSTDSESGWGGLGVFEYSQKGLPHALVHAPELVETYGHFGGACTCVGEAGHKTTIKGAAKLARTYGDRNETQEGMLEHVQRDKLWIAVISENKEAKRLARVQNESVVLSYGVQHSSDRSTDSEDALRVLCKLCEPIPALTSGWSHMRPVDGRPPRAWGATFLAKRLLITRTELVTLLRTKLQMAPTWSNIVLLATRLHWECYGSAIVLDPNKEERKIVGISNVSRKRRDFMRVEGRENNTALSVQVQMFVRVSGLHAAGIDVPEHLLAPPNDTCDGNMVTFALVRWLSPHPRAIVRDRLLRPICPAPFDINHALWTFSRTDRARGYFTDRLFSRQLHLFPGSTPELKRAVVRTHTHAMYDLIHLQTFKRYMNCTYVTDTHNSDTTLILETIIMPF